MRVWKDTCHDNIVRVHIDTRQWAEYDALVQQVISTVNVQVVPMSLLITRGGDGHFNGVYDHIRCAITAYIDLPMLANIVHVFDDPQCFPAVIIRTLFRVDFPQHEHRWYLVDSLDTGYHLLHKEDTSFV